MVTGGLSVACPPGVERCRMPQPAALLLGYGTGPGQRPPTALCPSLT